MTIGITGGTGSGKSAVAALLRQRGFAVYDCDSRARLLQDTDAALQQEIIRIFGAQAYSGATLNRTFVAQQAFAQPQVLQALSAAVHPKVKADFLQWKQERGNSEILFIESAILIESGFAALTDKILLVTAPRSLRVQRLLNRDSKATTESIAARIRQQSSEKTLRQHADFVIENAADLQALQQKTDRFITDVLKLC